MKILVFSDIHGNLPAAEAMLKKVGPVDSYICLGDIVNYAPWSNECVDLVNSFKNCIIIRGNHEEIFMNGNYSGKNKVVQAFFNYCYPSFDRLKDINNWPKQYSDKNFIFRHTLNDKHIYFDTPLKLNNNYIIGHSHHQFTRRQNNFRIHNTGSVGQNRRYINVINYTLYYPQTNTLEPQSLIYNVDLVINEMKMRRYPQFCIDYYNNKLRRV